MGAEADLVGDAKAGEAFHHGADHDAEHGQTAVPGFSEDDKAKAGSVMIVSDC
jgi:hypothetical protein